MKKFYVCSVCVVLIKMDPERGPLVVTGLVRMFLKEHVGEHIESLEFMLLDKYGAHTLRMLPWTDGRLFDQYYFNSGGPYCRVDHGFPRVNEVVHIAGHRMRVSSAGLFTFGAVVDSLQYSSDSSSDVFDELDEREASGDRL